MLPYGTEFGEQLWAYRQLLFARAMQLESSRAGADDLVQDTIERALAAADRFKPGTNLRAWLLTIMTHLFIDRRRRSAHETLIGGDKLARVAAPDSASPNAWETVSSVDLKRAVEQLQADLRSLVTLYLQGVCSYRQLSDRLGVPPNTVGTRLLRARRRMRSLLEQRTGVEPLRQAG
jgi:RNA polymerase sigma-70 factor, ECF subfamily